MEISWKIRSEIVEGMEFQYLSGEEVCHGDLVIAANQRAAVESIFYPGTQGAKDFSCDATGGLLLKFYNGDLQLWFAPEEDLEFVARKTLDI